MSFLEASPPITDGGYNICGADVMNLNTPKPKYYDSMEQFYGCCWSSYENLTIWRCDSEWSEKMIGDDYPANAKQDIMLLKRWTDGAELSAAEYARLAERGYVYVLNESGNIKVVPRIVILENSKIRAELLDIGTRVKEKHWNELSLLRDKHINAFLKETPPHLHKAQIYCLQHTFFSDPWLIVHMLKHLTGNGKLKLPANEQKKMLMTVLAIDK